MEVQEKENNKSVAVDWLQLPDHLTSIILSKLTSVFDYARFGLVCLQWQSISCERYYGGGTKPSLPPQPPLLVIPTPTPPEMMMMMMTKKKNDTSRTISCSFYRVTDGKIFNRLNFTVPHHRQFRGCGFGWLITVDEVPCYSVQLVNPFFYPNPNNTATKEIKLPPLTTHPIEISDPAYYINYAHLIKPVLSADPASNPKDCVVMAIFGGHKRLAFCRPEDKAWTPMIIDTSSVLQAFYDLTYYQGNFYALSDEGAVLVCDVATRTTTTFAEPPKPNFFSNKKYLVVSEGGELFQVHRFLNGGKYSKRFRVLKFHRRSETSTEWVEVKDLNDRSFFIGDSPSMSISPSDFPGCKPNCIYYTDDNVEYHWVYDHMREDGPCDLGVYNVENKSFEKHYVSDVALWPPPIWIQPMLFPPRSIAHSKE